MQVLDFLSLENIHICRDRQSKKQLLELLSKQVAISCGLDETKIHQEFLAREELGNTGLGNGVALPHVRLSNLAAPLGTFCMLSPSVDFDSPDQIPVDLVFGLAAPESETCQHLQILSKIAELFCQPEFREKLRQCESETAIYQLIKQSNTAYVQS